MIKITSRMRFVLTLSTIVGLGVVNLSNTGIAAGPINADPASNELTPFLANAIAKLDKKQYQEAINQLREIVKSDPSNADVWNLIGFAERKRGNLQQSASAYEKALSINPVHKRALAYQAELFATLGNTKAMQRNRKRLVTLCPYGCRELADLDVFINGGESKAYSR